MNKPYSLPVKVSALVCCSLVGQFSAAHAADIVLQKVPALTVEQAPAYPENLARGHFGARLEIATENLGASTAASAESALLSDDPTVGYALPSGTTNLLVSFPKIESLARISFLNDDAKGTVTIATSDAKLPATSPQWHKVDQREISSGAVTAPIGPVEAKYVRVSFDTAKAGRIAGFGVYSTPTVADFTMPRPRSGGLGASDSQSFGYVSYNLTDLHTKGRALYVSSGSDVKAANNIVDGQAATAFEFAKTDAAPIAIVDLGKTCKLHRLSAIYSALPGSVDFYLLKSLPKTEDSAFAEPADVDVRTVSNDSAAADAVNLPKVLRTNTEALGKLKPVGSVVNSANEGRAAVDFPETSARYVMVKWNPANAANDSFSLAEVAAFGSGKRTQSDRDGKEMIGGKEIAGGKEMADGKDILDNKDIPAEGAPNVPGEGPQAPPPSLPQPPPFTFIPQVPPQVPPTSP